MVLVSKEDISPGKSLNPFEFEGSMYPCPTRIEEYLEIQYGYIGEVAFWEPEINRWVKG